MEFALVWIAPFAYLSGINLGRDNAFERAYLRFGYYRQLISAGMEESRIQMGIHRWKNSCFAFPRI